MSAPSQKSGWPIVLTILLVSVAYAAVRTNVLRGVSWEHFPLLVTNKGFALASILCIVLSYVLGPLARFLPERIVPLLGLRKSLGTAGFGLGALHAFISVLLFSPENYGRFFGEDGRPALETELSMLFGILAFFLFGIIAISSIGPVAATLGEAQWTRIQRMGYAGMFLVFLHVLALGAGGWSEPGTWPGYLAPATLIAAIVITAAMLLRVVVWMFPSPEYRRKNG